MTSYSTTPLINNLKNLHPESFKAYQKKTEENDLAVEFLCNARIFWDWARIFSSSDQWQRGKHEEGICGFRGASAIVRPPVMDFR